MKLEEFLVLDLQKKFGMTREEADKLAEKDGNAKRASNLYLIQRFAKKEQKPRLRPCEKCGGEVHIGTDDIGGIDVQYQYWRACLNCLDNDVSESQREQWVTWTLGAGPDSDFNPYR